MTRYDPLLLELLRLIRSWDTAVNEADLKDCVSPELWEAWLSTAPRKPAPRKPGGPTIRIRNNLTGEVR